MTHHSIVLGLTQVQNFEITLEYCEMSDAFGTPVSTALPKVAIDGFGCTCCNWNCVIAHRLIATWTIVCSGLFPSTLMVNASIVCGVYAFLFKNNLALKLKAR